MYRESESDRYSIEAFFEQFPGLISGEKPLVYGHAVESVEVREADLALMNRTPQVETACGSLVDINDVEQIVLLDSEMNALATVRPEEDHHSNYAYQDDTHRHGETVAEAMQRLADPDAVRWILYTHRGFVVEDHRSSGGYHVILYRAPETWSLSDYREARETEAREKVQAAIAAAHRETMAVPA